MRAIEKCAVAVVIVVPADGQAGSVLATAIRAALAPTTRAADPDAPIVLDVVAIGPHQINALEGDLVTVTYPVGATTVMSVQPDGTVATRPPGTRGPYETGLLGHDRIIFAPHGTEGPVYLVPYTDVIPNE